MGKEIYKEGAIRASKIFEGIWRIKSYPRGHTSSEIQNAEEFLASVKPNYKIMAEFETCDAKYREADLKVLILVSMGLHHRLKKLPIDREWVLRRVGGVPLSRN